MVVLLAVEDYFGGGIDDGLNSGKMLFWQASESGIAIINPGHDEGGHESFSTDSWQSTTHTSNLSKHGKACANDAVDL